MRIFCVRMALVSLLTVVMGGQSLAQQQVDEATQKAFGEWDQRQIMLIMSGRCPVMEPWLHWGLAAQLDNLTKKGSKLWKIVVGPSEATGMYSLNDLQDSMWKVMVDREKEIRKSLKGVSCTDPTYKGWLDQAPLYAKYGFYEEMYVFTKIEGGYCTSNKAKPVFAAALQADLDKIAAELPQVSTVKTEIDGTEQSKIDWVCSVGGIDFPRDLFTRYLQKGYEAEVLGRKAGRPMARVTPLEDVAGALRVKAFRGREGQDFSTLDEDTRLVETSCPHEPRSHNSDGIFLRSEKSLSIEVVVDKSKDLIVDVSGASAIKISDLRLAGPFQSEVLPLKGEDLGTQEGSGRHLYRYTFEGEAVNAFFNERAYFSVKFDGFYKGTGGRITSGCNYLEGELEDALNWATGSGVGWVIE